MKRAIFPGSFDPITMGHVDIIRRSLPLFDELIIAIGVNSTKKYMFSLDQRKAFIEATFADEPKIKVDTYEGLTVDYCEEIEATTKNTQTKQEEQTYHNDVRRSKRRQLRKRRRGRTRRRGRLRRRPRGRRSGRRQRRRER